MKKKIHHILNIIMGTFIGLFVGSTLYRCWHFRKYPDLYAAQSAPWYITILIQALFTVVLLAVCMIVKVTLIENIRLMEKSALILGIIFLVLTVAGGGYVIINHGQANAGYAVVPGIWTIVCFGYYRRRKQYNDQTKTS